MNVRFHRLAAAEIDHEVDYYESRQAGLGEELEDQIDVVVAMVRRFPEAARNGSIDMVGASLRSIDSRSFCRISSSATRS